MNKPCMAITLIPGVDPQYATAYHWCQKDEHPEGTLHECYCGLLWWSSDLVEPTVEMRVWRTGSDIDVRKVSGRMLG